MESLRKMLDNKLILDDLSFEVGVGDSFCLLGPNGAGKTTTIRVILGIYRPDGGKIFVKGIDVSSDVQGVREFIGYLPETPSLYERLTVYRNLEFYGRLFDIRGEALDRRIKDLINLLGLREKMYERVGRLSKGLKQRVALARALINDPEILILDQPTSDLDPGMAHSIRSLIKTLNREYGITLLVCTHNLVEAEEICERTAIINEGRIIGSGYISDLKRGFLSDHIFKISVLTPIHKYLRILDTMDYVVDYSVSDEYTLYVKLRDKDLVSAVVEVLVRSGAKIFEVRYSEPKLEDVYLKLVGDEFEV